MSWVLIAAALTTSRRSASSSRASSASALPSMKARYAGEAMTAFLIASARPARRVRAREPVPQRDRLGQALARLARRDAAHQRVDAGGPQPAHERPAVQRVHGLVGDDGDRGAVDQADEALQQLAHPGDDVDRV